MIRRDYIAAYLYSRAMNDKITGQMLCEYANMHHPEKFGITKARIDEECENKNNRLDERIAEFTAKETVRAEAAAKKAAKTVELKKRPKATPGSRRPSRSKRLPNRPANSTDCLTGAGTIPPHKTSYYATNPAVTTHIVRLSRQAICHLRNPKRR